MVMRAIAVIAAATVVLTSVALAHGPAVKSPGGLDEDRSLEVS